jgi:hypothetical protein
MAMVVDAGVAGTMAAPSRQMAAVGTASSSSSPCVVGMGVRSLPVCRGLRRVNLGVKVSSRVVRSASSSSSSSRGNIVSEAQETVTGGTLIPRPSVLNLHLFLVRGSFVVHCAGIGALPFTLVSSSVNL